MSASPFSLIGVGPIISRWKYLIGAAVVLAAVVSIIVALQLPNIYKSTAVFFPTNPQSTDPDRIVEGAKLEISGRPEDLDRVITIGESEPVARLIIKKFDLYKRYKIDPNSETADNAVLQEFTGNLDILHNERDAIELTFTDKDKTVAAQIANAMVQVIDSVNQQLTLENRRNVLALYRQRYDYFNTSFERSRRQLVAARNRYGVFGLEQQGRYLSKAIVETETALRKAEAGGGGNVAALKNALRGLTRTNGGNVINLESYVNGVDSLGMFTQRVTDLQGRMIGARAAYEVAELAIKGRISSIYVVQQALPATKKSAPVRWLIVMSSVVITFVLSVIVVALLEIFHYNRTRTSLS